MARDNRDRAYQRLSLLGEMHAELSTGIRYQELTGDEDGQTIAGQKFCYRVSEKYNRANALLPYKEVDEMKDAVQAAVGERGYANRKAHLDLINQKSETNRDKIRKGKRR